jgi:hypothetical protein
MRYSYVVKRASRLLPLLAAAALAACTPMRWEHPSLGAAQTEADLGECGRAAWIEAQHQSFLYGGFYRGPSYYRGRDGRLYYDPFWGNRMNDTFYAESRLRDYCMRSKGYNLVPVS